MRRPFATGVLIALAAVGARADGWKALTRSGTQDYKKNDFKSAHDKFTAASQKAPENPLIRFNKGCAAYKLGDLDGAVKDFSETRFEPDKPHSRAATDFNLGNVYYKKGDLKQAAESYIKALTLDPNDKDARHNLALALKKEEQKQEKDQDKNQSQGGGGAGGDQNKDKNDKDKDKGGEDQKDSGSRMGEQEIDAALQAFQDEQMQQARKMQKAKKPEFNVDKDW
ncbi:MAG: tetratricopeptide repeat protein [Elusimicrobiota bacterium]